MRPANLIPAEERRSTRTGIRSAPMAYLVVGALLLALGAVTLLVTTNNEIATRKDEVAVAEQKKAAAEARASQLAAYTQFHSVATQRISTITNLADSRFDWVKVLRQLALVKQRKVWLTNLTGTIRPDVTVGGGENVALRASIPGPALSIAGCAVSQEAVAGFIAALRDVDGVTRVGLQASGSAEGGSASASGASCSQTKFQLAIAFDAAPIPTPLIGEGAIVEEAAPEATTEEAGAEGAEAESSEPTEETPEGE